MWSFVRWDLHTPTIARIVYMLVVAAYMAPPYLEEEDACVFVLSTPTETFVFQTVGAAPPWAHTALPVTRNSPTSESVGRMSCHSFQLLVPHPPSRRLMKLCFTGVIPWNVSVLHQNLSVERFFRSPLCPLSFPRVSLLPLCLIPRILPSSYTACVSSFPSNERQGSARQTPGVWQSYLLCLHISSSIALSLSLFRSHSLCLSRPLSLNTRAVDSWQFDSKLFPRVGSSCHDRE